MFKLEAPAQKEDKMISDGKVRNFQFPEDLGKVLKVEKIVQVYYSQKSQETVYVVYEVSSKEAQWKVLTLVVEYQNFKPSGKYLASTSRVSSVLLMNQILILGTMEGSLSFYDLRERQQQHEDQSNQYQEFLNAQLEKVQARESRYVLRFPSF